MRLTQIGASENDNELLIAQKQFLVYQGTGMSVGGLVWGTLLMAYDLPIPAIIPYAYTLLTVMNFWNFHQSKNFIPVRHFQTSISLLLPFMLQWVLGGFEQSGAVMLWSILALASSATYLDARSSILWLVAFIVLTLGSFYFDNYFAERFARHFSSEASRLFLLINIALNGTVLFGLFLYYVESQKKIARELRVEKVRGDKLMLNILPEPIANELIKFDTVRAKQHGQVTVLFTDFQGFTELAGKTKAQHLVDQINTCFSAFDYLSDRFKVEKIKTIGDSYMAAAGLEGDSVEGAIHMLQFGLRIQRFMKKHNEKRVKMGLKELKMRVGIHTGPVASGVVGIKKFQYDIWGDTVNTASRMESSGAVGKVNISETTYELIKNDFRTEPRGEIEVKGKGKLKMYFVSGMS